MLKDLLGRLGASVAGAIVLALAALLATIAAAFAVYAFLASLVSPASAGGFTALLFAIVMLVIAALTPRLLGVRATSPHDKRPSADPAGATMMMEIAAATAGVVSELLMEHRANRAAKRKQKRKSAHRRR